MKIEDFAPISQARLKRIRWQGERSYRVLSHSFSVRWSGSMTADRVDYVWGGFAVLGHHSAETTSVRRNGASIYSLIDLGPEDPRRYRLLLNDQQLISSRRQADVLSHLLWQIFRRMHEKTEEFLLIHAGSVVTPRGAGVLLPADSGFGKTTLVAGLIQTGFGFLSDEIGVIDHRAGVLRPYPRALNFKEGSSRLFADLLSASTASRFARSDGYLRAEEIRSDVIADPCEVRFVIAPRYREGVATQITPLSPAATVKELWINAANLHLYGARALPILSDVATRAKGYRLVSGDLGEAIRAVVGVTGTL